MTRIQNVNIILRVLLTRTLIILWQCSPNFPNTKRSKFRDVDPLKKEPGFMYVYDNTYFPNLRVVISKGEILCKYMVKGFASSSMEAKLNEAYILRTFTRTSHSIGGIGVTI